MNPNTLIFPEGDRERRRHAHTACVAQQRATGKLLTRSEWERAQKQTAPTTVRLFGRAWWRRLIGL